MSPAQAVPSPTGAASPGQAAHPISNPNQGSTEPGPGSIQAFQAGAKGSRAKGSAGDQSATQLQSLPCKSQCQSSGWKQPTTCIQGSTPETGHLYGRGPCWRQGQRRTCLYQGEERAKGPTLSLNGAMGRCW